MVDSLDLEDPDDEESVTYLTPPTLLGYSSHANDFPGAALQVWDTAQDGDTLFFSISVKGESTGALIGNSAIFALVVGPEPNVCVGWGSEELWDYGNNCKEGSPLIWIILGLAVAAGAAYFFLM